MSGLAKRFRRWARRHRFRVLGLDLWLLLQRSVKRFLDVRAMGLAAEMTYYALLSLFPLVGALGASIGFVERLVGAEAAQRAEAAVLAALDAVFSPEVTADVMAPLVSGLLQEERAGFALSGFVISLFFASRIFRSAIEALDATYRLEAQRGTLGLWGMGLVFALFAVVVATVLVAMVVVGPLLGGGHALAAWLGLGTVVELGWTVLRWPVVVLVAAGFLSVLYRYGPKVRVSWRASLPGAVVGVTGLILVAVGFRLYIEFTGLNAPQITDPDEAVAIALQLVGALMAVLFWLWLSCMMVVAGGVINAETTRALSRLARRRARRGGAGRGLMRPLVRVGRRQGTS